MRACSRGALPDSAFAELPRVLTRPVRPSQHATPCPPDATTQSHRHTGEATVAGAPDAFDPQQCPCVNTSSGLVLKLTCISAPRLCDELPQAQLMHRAAPVVGVARICCSDHLVGGALRRVSRRARTSDKSRASMSSHTPLWMRLKWGRSRRVIAPATVASPQQTYPPWDTPPSRCGRTGCASGQSHHPADMETLCHGCRTLTYSHIPTCVAYHADGARPCHCCRTAGLRCQHTSSLANCIPAAHSPSPQQGPAEDQLDGKFSCCRAIGWSGQQPEQMV